MVTPSSEPMYTMTVSLSVFDHLGIGLYSNVPAVLSEVVANAWDADAEHVEIEIDSDRDRVVITDDGHGMTLQDINEKYLKIGFRKREQPDFGRTEKFDRQPMGRKGIGKLSVFAIAEAVEIHTVTDREKHALRLNSKEIRSQSQGDRSETYNPPALSLDRVEIGQGTRIILSNLLKRIDSAPTNLRRRLARRFSIIGTKNFNVIINGEPISVKDRDYQKFIEYVWHFNENKSAIDTRFPAAKCKTPEDHSFGPDNEYEIKGWIGTVANQKQIREDTNVIVIFASGKLVHEDLLNDMQKGGIWTKYVIGEIDANFLDDNEQEDMITSARQRVKEDDPRYRALRNFLEQGALKSITTNWQRLRRAHGADDTLKSLPSIKAWFDGLGEDQKKAAKGLLGKISALEEVSDEDKRDLIKGAIIAFQHLDATRQLHVLEDVDSADGLALLSKTFGSIRNLESAYYYDVVKLRLNVIKKFKRLDDQKEQEKVLQEYIFDELWLIDLTWARTARDKVMEEYVATQFKNEDEKLTKEEMDGRVDIHYRLTTGRHVIIELKRGDEKTNVEVTRITNQLAKYESRLKKCLQQYDESYSRKPIDLICITGRPVTHPNWDQERIDGHLKNAGVTALTYKELIRRALASHDDYLQAEKKHSSLVMLMDRIDEDFEKR